MAEKREFSNTSTSSINEGEEEIDIQQHKDLKKKNLFQRATHKTNKRTKERFFSSSKVKEPVNKDLNPLSPEEHHLSPPAPLTATAWEHWSKESPSSPTIATHLKILPPVNPPFAKEPIKGVHPPVTKHTPQSTSLEAISTPIIMTHTKVKDYTRHKIRINNFELTFMYAYR